MPKSSIPPEKNASPVTPADKVAPDEKSGSTMLWVFVFILVALGTLFMLSALPAID